MTVSCVALLVAMSLNINIHYSVSGIDMAQEWGDHRLICHSYILDLCPHHMVTYNCHTFFCTLVYYGPGS